MTPTSSNDETNEMFVENIASIARDVCLIELRSQSPLPQFTAGAHIDVHIPNGMIRSYSLINSQQERNRFVIAVRRDPDSRGGSCYLHDRIQPQQTLIIGGPRNHFPLNESVDESIFIAGGIGITPLWAMIQQLSFIGKPWKLFYRARTADRAPFLDVLRKIARPGQFASSFGSDARFRLNEIVAQASVNAHLYCCGPSAMLSEFEHATRDRSSETVHLEHFSGKQANDINVEFNVRLARSGVTFKIPAGMSILDVLRKEGIDVSYSCTEGVCGACETAVLEGCPLHRDLLLNAEEKASNKTMMICCSRAQGEQLVLDL